MEDYLISFNVNTIAPAMICYHFLPEMIERGTGRILNTTSGIALDVCQAGYSASKAALDKITIDLGRPDSETSVQTVREWLSRLPGKIDEEDENVESI